MNIDHSKYIMGFHAVAFGLFIKHSAELADLIRLVAKSAVVVLPNGERIEYNPLVQYPPDADVELTLHDDVICDRDDDEETITTDFDSYSELIFKYSRNERIRIGHPHCCAFMIHLGCVGDDLGGEDGQIEIEDQIVNDLLTWKQQLVQDGRLQPGCKLQLVGNCCS